MTTQQLAEQKRLEEILKLARMQLNDEYMKKHSVAHTSWLTTARTAWTNSGVLLPFATKFVYPSEEEVVARGVEIYNTLLPTGPAATTPPALVTTQPTVVEEINVEPVTELLQAGGDFVIAEVAEEEILPLAAEEDITTSVVQEETPLPTVEEDITDVVIKEETPAAPLPTVTDSLLENKFKSLFTKWGGRGNY